MKTVTYKNIVAFIETIVKDTEYNRAAISIKKRTNGINISMEAMYDSPFNPSYANLKRVSEFFKTDEINVNDYSMEGCETCDFGSSYSHTLNIINPGVKIVEKSSLKETIKEKF